MSRAVNGNHLSNDGAFIEKRRRGLARFLNALTRHPVLGSEQLVVMFLTVPTVCGHAMFPPPQIGGGALTALSRSSLFGVNCPPS